MDGRGGGGGWLVKLLVLEIIGWARTQRHRHSCADVVEESSER